MLSKPHAGGLTAQPCGQGFLDDKVVRDVRSGGVGPQLGPSLRWKFVVADKRGPRWIDRGSPLVMWPRRRVGGGGIIRAQRP